MSNGLGDCLHLGHNVWIPFDLEAERELELAVFNPGPFYQPHDKPPKGLHVQFKLLFNLGVGGEFALRGGNIVDPIVEGATHSGRLRGQRNVERFNAHDLDEYLAVSLSGSFLSSEFLDLLRVLILSGASASVIIKRHGD